MTNYQNLLLVLFAFFFLFMSCEKDKTNEEPEIKTNQIVYNGVEHELSWGKLMYDGLDDGLHFSSIALYSGSIHYDSNSGMSGTGHAFWFEDVISSSSNIQGTYQPFDWSQNIDWDNYDFDTNPVEQAGLIMECELIYNRTYPANTEEERGDIYEFYKGELKISKEGINYIILFDGKDDRGIAISLYYKGELIEN